MRALEAGDVGFVAAAVVVAVAGTTVVLFVEIVEFEFAEGMVETVGFEAVDFGFGVGRFEFAVVVLEAVVRIAWDLGIVVEMVGFALVVGTEDAVRVVGIGGSDFEDGIVGFEENSVGNEVVETERGVHSWVWHSDLIRTVHGVEMEGDEVRVCAVVHGPVIGIVALEA